MDDLILDRLHYFLQVFRDFVSPEKSFICWLSLTAAAFMTTGPLLHAGTRPGASPIDPSTTPASSPPEDSPAPTPPPAPPKDSHTYKTIQINSGGKPIMVRVQQQPDPLKNVTFHDDLDSHRAFSATNDMANKSFSATAGAGWNKAADVKAPDAIGAKPYKFDEAAPTAPNLGTKASFRSASFKSDAAVGFDKSFSTAAANASQGKTAVLGVASSQDQDRTAQLGGQEISKFASSMADKTFQGPEADAAHQHLKRLGNGQIEIADIPNRPLSIDEVRDLINHGFKPNTSAPPPEASKPMNDPDYVPQPLRDDPSAGRSTPPVKASDDDKDDAVPPPGTLSPPPENSEPLPKR